MDWMIFVPISLVLSAFTLRSAVVPVSMFRREGSSRNGFLSVKNERIDVMSFFVSFFPCMRYFFMLVTSVKAHTR